MQQGTPAEIYHAPVSRFVADFIGSANFLNVRREGDQWFVADGTALRVHAQPEGDRDRPLSALVRPEAIRVERTDRISGTPDDAPTVNRLRGVVTRSVFLGAYIEHMVEIAGRQVRAHTREAIPAGTPITLVFNAADCRLVDNND
jgi:iron(III) transport system ATP-binding protein